MTLSRVSESRRWSLAHDDVSQSRQGPFELSRSVAADADSQTGFFGGRIGLGGVPIRLFRAAAPSRIHSVTSPLP